MNQKVLVDAGPIVAIYAERDAAHTECVALLEDICPPMITTWAVLAEVCWLLRNRPNLVQSMLKACGDGLLALPELDELAFSWISEFMTRYVNLQPQLADASLVYLAQRDRLDTIFTLDRRDFSIYRFGKNQAFHLLP